MGFWWGPNQSTRHAAAHPGRYATVMGLMAAGLAAAAGASQGPGVAIVIAFAAFLIVAGVTLFLWRDGGPGSNWAKRHSAGGGNAGK